MKILDYSNFYLVGIKGVAMTSIAQCLRDAGKNITGSDVGEDFVTKRLLDELGSIINIGFDNELPEDIDCVIYTSAHKGIDNPQVQNAIKQNIKTYSQAEALGELFNEKQGLAVCGVGGKSTVSAMITWIMEKTGHKPSFSVGVGDISGINRTGAWRKKSEFFIAEADEYVVDPNAPQKKQEIVPRFFFLKPFVTVCTNLAFDHPDVYRDFKHTKSVYKKFFKNIKKNGTLIFNADNEELFQIILEIRKERDDIKFLSFGESEKANFRLLEYAVGRGKNSGSFSFYNQNKNLHYVLTLKIPGRFNILNGLSAIAACYSAGISISDSIDALASFNSTMRRFEYKGEINGIKCYDDYAHHPNEVAAAIQALNEWFPHQRKVIAFQSHTYSRTKKFFDEFVDSFSEAKEVVMINIFSSAREKDDPSVSSTLLCEEIGKRYPSVSAENLGSIEKLEEFFESELKKGDVFLTLGAGDIYEVYEKLFE